MNQKKAVILQSQLVMEAGENPAQTRCCNSQSHEFRIFMSLMRHIGKARNSRKDKSEDNHIAPDAPSVRIAFNHSRGIEERR